jgi:flagellar hook-associated protein 3 FlgL
MNSQYIFGGYNTTRQPFTVDAGGNILYNGVDMVTGDPADLAALQAEQMQFEVASGGLYINVSFTGVDILGTGTDNLYHILDSLYNDLTAGVPEATISAYADVLQEKQSEVLGRMADIGARTNRLELLKTRYEDDLVSYKTVKSRIEDADLAEVVMNYKMAEAVYTASLNAGSGIIQHTLLDYL